MAQDSYEDRIKSRWNRIFRRRRGAQWSRHLPNHSVLSETPILSSTTEEMSEFLLLLSKHQITKLFNHFPAFWE